MENKNTIMAISYILSGSLLLVFNDITEGWLGKLLVLIGYILYFIGLKPLILGLDEVGQKAAKNIKTGIILGIIGIVVDFVPIIGVVSVIFYLLAFIFQLLGLLKLKKSQLTGKEGIKGINYILIAIGIGIFQGVLSMIPMVGKKLVFIAAIIYIVFIIIGWINVQKGIYHELCISKKPEIEK